MKRLVAIGVIWAGCAMAWMMLGATVSVRTHSSGASYADALAGLWGPPSHQRAPSVRFATDPRPLSSPSSAPAWMGEGAREAADAPRAGVHADNTPLASAENTSREATRPPGVLPRLTRTHMSVEFDLEHRKKGLQWFPTYDVSFVSDYDWTYEGEGAAMLEFSFPLEGAGDSFDGFVVMRGDERVRTTMVRGEARWTARVEGGETPEVITYRIRYRTRGVDRWTYRPTEGTGELENFHVSMRVNTADIDFAPGSLSPSSHHQGPGSSWEGLWEFEQLISDDAIAIVMPQRINPGPLASKVTLFAPVSLLFFFFVVALVARARHYDLHPMHFFFFGCAFFAFNLLFAYLVDHMEVGWSFFISASVSLFLSVSYARHFVSLRFAVQVIGGAQLIYLVLFSASFFLEGFTGLTVTIGAVLTLYVMMQLTGRTVWGAKPADEAEVYVPPPPGDGSPAAF